MAEIFKVHIPFLDDVKEKGLKDALVAKTDESVERLTAGMNIEAVRSMLRGDPVTRPNPRVKPHADGFWLHMRPTYFNKKVMPWYPTFRLGFLAVYFLVVETITGVILMFWYTPSTLVAYENMLNIMGNVPLGLMLRDLHKIGAEAMVAIVLLHMLRTYVTGSYKKPRQFTWHTGVWLLLFTLFLSFSGYLLPWDQLSLWAVTIGASMSEAAPPPVVGRIVDVLVRGGPGFGDIGLLRFYLGHVLLLPILLFIALGIHYYKVIIHGHSLPPGVEADGEDTARKVPMGVRDYFMPDVMTKELYWIALWTFIIIFAVTVGNLYHAPLEPHADPQITPLHTTAPWYFLWLQGMLKLGDKLIWGIIAPTVLLGFAFVLSYLEVGPSRRYIRRRLGMSFAALTVAVFAILSYMGTPYYAVSSSPDQEVMAVLAPQTHPGPLRGTPAEELVVGEYSTHAVASVPTAGLLELMELYEEELVKFGDDLPDSEGLMIIEDWQVGLKKITLRVLWNGGERAADLAVYLHADSNYED